MKNEQKGAEESPGGASSALIPLFLLAGCAALIAWLQIVSVLSGAKTPPLVLRRTIFQEGENGCGPAALAMVLAEYGVNCSPSEVAALHEDTAKGMSMRDLKSIAESQGLTASGWHLTFEDLRSAPKPAILLVSGGHFLVIDSIDGRGRAICRDPQAGNILYTREMLGAIWRGEALLFARSGQ